ncbi:MAG: winged helix DNA-binding domain-containing protein [Candidatus Nanopelagicales bacterium]
MPKSTTRPKGTAPTSAATTLEPRRALGLRLRSLLLQADPAVPVPASVSDVVTWFGAMQAQDHGSGLWSLGVRLDGWTVDDVQSALERREALRTWPMRGTVHLVPARDAHWMLDLMGAKPLAGAARRREFLGLDERTADRAVEVLGSALAGGGRLTRAQCLETLADAGINGAGNYGYHLLWYASQRGVTCIAPHVDGEQTFALLDEWVPDPVRLDRDEALATIAERFVRSHGPVPLSDLTGWTGLGVRECRRGLELAGDAVTEVELDGRPAFVATTLLDAAPDDAAPGPGHLALPGFDEYLLGYKDRSLMLSPADANAVVPGGNGMFRATWVRDGRVAGTWTKGSSRTRLVIDAQPLTRTTRRDRAGLESALATYAAFLGRDLEVRWPEPTPRR